MEPPRPVPALTDDPLREIFLRIGSPADLARTAAACVAFRRLIADPTFLRRYRSLHPPLLLGLLEPDGYGFQPADEAPHPSAAPLARAADFSFHDYLPRVGTGDPWILFGAGDGLVLFKRILEEEEEERIFFADLAVCDPFARRCMLLPPVPDALFGSVQVQRRRCHELAAFIVVPSRDGEEDDTSFRVIVRLNNSEMEFVFIFSSTTNHWSAAKHLVWDDLSIPVNERLMSWPSSNYAYGCFYWKALSKNAWLKFDMSSMEFSVVDLPPARRGRREIFVAEAGEGRVGMFGLTDDGTSLCRYSIGQIGGETSDQSKVDSIIPLPAGYLYYKIGDISEGHIFIMGHHGPDMTGNTCFAIQIKTMKIEIVWQTKFNDIYPYFGFPPSMSRRRI